LAASLFLFLNPWNRAMSNITTWSLVTARGVLLLLTVNSCLNCNNKHVRILFTAVCLSRMLWRVSNHVFLLQSPHNRTCDRPTRPSNRTVTVKSERFSRSTRDLKQQYSQLQMHNKVPGFFNFHMFVSSKMQRFMCLHSMTLSMPPSSPCS